MYFDKNSANKYMVKSRKDMVEQVVNYFQSQQARRTLERCH